MNILQVLCLLQLLAVPAFTLTRPSHDYWGEFGAYGPCSRSCGTGVAMRTRKCITSRTDGGHNCVGSSKSFRVCNTQECPVGSIDFREEQCSQFDRANFQGKPYSWVPYYGATNPCELNCVPRGENFFYRHKPAVVDGTKCYVGRSDICVDGVCRLLTLGEFPGLDDDVNSVHSTTPVDVVQHPRETRTYRYRPGVFGECSATCNGGMQYRPVECIVQGSGTPQVVDESNCIAQRLLRPASQQACNMQPCGAEYSVSSFSVCSVTCGEGQQTREVFCVGPGGERLAEHACRGLVHPPAVQACRRPACHTHITWHVTEFGLCTRSCGGGVRERRVGCFDTDLNPFEEARCGPASRPSTVETCNTQPCPGAQTVASVQDPRVQGSTVRGFVPHVPGDSSAVSSMQDPRVQGSTMRGFVPHVPGESSAQRLPTDMPADPFHTIVGPYCAQSLYGCCPDGHTSATGPRNEGCPQEDCVRSRYGCCLDGVTPARGLGRAGCPDYAAAMPSSPPARPPSGDVCSLPRDEGSCDTWRVRFYYDSAAGKCTEFWYGNCEGNGNNFTTLEECQRVCGGSSRATPRPTPRATPRASPRATPRRGATRALMRARP